MDAAYRVHTNLGPGLLESAYEAVLAYELRKRGHSVATQVPLALRYEQLVLNDAYRVDMIVDELVIVELKSLETITNLHSKQLLTYLRLSDRRLGLLVNFGAELLRYGLKRVVNRLPATPTGRNGAHTAQASAVPDLAERKSKPSRTKLAP